MKYMRLVPKLAAVALSSLVLSLAACGGSSSSQTQSGETRTEIGSGSEGELTFVYMGDVGQQEAFNALFAKFSSVEPNIKVKIQGIPSGDWATFSNTVSTRLAGGEEIDIIQVATEGQSLFASKGILTDLTPFIEQDKEYVDEYLSDIDPKLVEFNEKYASGPNGETLFIPGGYNTMAMYLNKKVFDDAGVPIPEDGNWTWDEFLAAGKQIKERTGAYLMPSSNSYFGAIMPWLTTNGASPFSEDWKTATIDTPEAVEAAQFARQLAELELVPEPGGQFDADSAFAQGKLAIIPGGRWITIGLRATDQVENAVVVNWPTKRQNGTPVGWDAWNITERSQNKEAAWKFIKFMMSKEGSEFFASEGGTIVPARLSVANSDYFLKNAPEHSERLAEALSWATAIPSIARGAEAQKEMEEAWLTIISGQGDAAEILQQTQATLENLLQG